MEKGFYGVLQVSLGIQDTRYKICKLYPSLMVRQMLFGLSSLRHERDHHSENEQQADSETVNEDSEDLVQDEHADAGFEDKEDGVHNYHCARLTFGLLMMCFSDSEIGRASCRERV